jgi:hypothetical protein
VQIEETIPYTSSSATLLVRNSGGSWLNFFVSGELQRRLFAFLVLL